MRHIKARKGFFFGDRYRTPEDPPFPVDDHRAGILVKQGLADFVQPVAVAGEDVLSALHPGPAKAQRATARK